LGVPGVAPSTSSPTAGVPSAQAWSVIEFVDVTDAFGAHSSLHADLRNVGAPGMQFTLVATGAAEDVLRGAMARLHIASAGPVVLALGAVPVISSRRGAPPSRWTYQAPFAWQGAALDEAYIEVDLGASGRYWLEIPYGFVAGPTVPRGAHDAREVPRRVPAMAQLAARDRWVPWRVVDYDLGAIQNGWRLTARLSNPFDAHAELELYRDDSQVGRSVYLWTLRNPETSVEIVQADGSTLHAMAMEVRLHSDGMRRSDDFHFDRSGGSTQRATGTFRAIVDGRTVQIVIPSSLYGYTHGTADPYDAHRVVDAEHVLGANLF
jgi:hypothetical protein